MATAMPVSGLRIFWRHKTTYEETMKTLSIIIPIYNTPEEYFSKCLASLQCAHAHEVEIIAVDDGSKPEFSAKIQKLIDSSPLDIQYYKKENGGQNSAREYGLERSDGQHIFFMDADDYVDTIVLDKIIALLKKYHPKVLAFNYDVRSPNGVLLESMIVGSKNTVKRVRIPVCCTAIRYVCRFMSAGRFVSAGFT